MLWLMCVYIKGWTLLLSVELDRHNNKIAAKADDVTWLENTHYGYIRTKGIVITQ